MGCRGCLVSFVVVLLIIAGLLGGGYYLITQPSSLVADLPVIAPSEEGALAYDSKMSRFLNALASTSPFDDSTTAVLELSEEEATSKLAEAISSGQLPIDVASPQVHFRDERMQVSADVSTGAITVNVALQTQITVNEGKPDLFVERIDVGRLTVPDLLTGVLLDSIAAGADPMRAKLESLSSNITSITPAEGVLQVEGLKPPR